MTTSRDTFQWNDPLLFNDQLTEEEQMIRDATQAFVAKVLAPRVNEAFQHGEHDKCVMKELGRAGLLGATIHGYGCPGINNVSYGLIMRELERLDSGYRSMASVQGSLVMHPIDRFGSHEQKERFLPLLAKGEFIGAFGLTEPDHGSDPGSLKTRATITQGGYILNGSKMWITQSPLANIFIVWAKNDAGRLRGFILERGMAGLSTPEMQGKWSLRVSVTGEIIMHDVFVPKENELPLADGLKAPFACLDSARFGIAWGALGAAEACWHIARQYTLDRIQFGLPLAANQLIQFKLADMQTQITLGLQGVLRLGRLKDENKIQSPMISMMKRYSTLAALEIAREARDMLGANGIMEDFHVIRHLLNLETVKTYEGTADIHALVLGRAQTGIQAFKPLGNVQKKSD